MERKLGGRERENMNEEAKHTHTQYLKYELENRHLSEDTSPFSTRRKQGWCLGKHLLMVLLKYFSNVKHLLHWYTLSSWPKIKRSLGK